MTHSDTVCLVDEHKKKSANRLRMYHSRRRELFAAFLAHKKRKACEHPAPSHFRPSERSMYGFIRRC